MRHRFLATIAIAACINAALVRREGKGDFAFATRVAQIIVRNATGERTETEFEGAVLADAAINEEGPFLTRLLDVWDDVIGDLKAILHKLLALVFNTIPEGPTS